MKELKFNTFNRISKNAIYITSFDEEGSLLDEWIFRYDESANTQEILTSFNFELMIRYGGSGETAYQLEMYDLESEELLELLELLELNK